MLKKRPLIAIGLLVVVLALIGGLSTRRWKSGFVDGQRELTAAEREALTASVESSLPGAGAARFVWYPLREAADGVYCALINTSNVAGDHSEDRLFEVVFAPSSDHGIKSVTSVYMPGGDPSWSRIIRGNCAKAGYVASAPGGAVAG